MAAGRQKHPPHRRAVNWSRTWLVALAAAAALDATHGEAIASRRKQFEVWVTDQSGTAGKLHIYGGNELIDNPASAVAEVVDLGGAVSAQCLSDTGATPTRAHIVLFDPTEKIAILSYVASGHVVFLDARTRAPIKCLRTSVGFNGARQAHAAFPAPNGKYIVIANQNGRLLERINTDTDGDGRPYEDAADLTLDSAAALDLTTCITNAGQPCQDPVLRPTNNVICPIVDDTSTLTFITLGGGGLLVANTAVGGVPPPVVASYDRDTVQPNGCGGMQASTQAANRIFINAGAFTGTPDSAALYSLPGGVGSYTSTLPNVPAPTTIFSFDALPPTNDSHGMTLVKPGKRVLWVDDRAANTIQVVDVRRNKHINTIDLTSVYSSDPAPDLLAASPKGRHAFIALRGPCPLTANDPTSNNAVGSTPGLLVVKVRGRGRGKILGLAPITDPAPAPFDCAARTDDTPGGIPTITERADAHGIAVRSVPRGE